MKDLIKAAQPKLKPLTVRKAPPLRNNTLQRNYWAAILKVTGQADVDADGVLSRTKKKITKQQAEAAWYLLNVKHHVDLKNYSRQTGITAKGILHINEDTKWKINMEILPSFIKKITGKVKQRDWTSKTFA